jgi:Ca-activated chloride channel family protein
VSPDAFTHPEWLLPLSLAIAACVIALAVARARARNRWHRLLGPTASRFAGGRWSDGALLVAAVAIAIALLGPRFGERIVRTPISGVDVVFLVDVSRSMDARDTPPSRLDRARRASEEILARLAPGDRAGLAVFAGRGLLLAPLTPDHAAVVDLLSGLDTALIAPASSNLGDGIAAALNGFEVASERPRVVVVASDGEDPDRGRDLGAEAALAQRARVVTIALGSEAGAGVPDGDRPLRDGAGDTVHSRRQHERLATLAAATDGASFVGDAFGRIDFARAAAEVRRDARAAALRAGASRAGGWVERRVAAPRAVPFAVLAFALLLLEALPRVASETRGRLRPKAADRMPAAAVALAATVAVAAAVAHDADSREPRASATHAEAAARVRARPDDARAQLELGLACLETERNEAAVRAFAAASVFARNTPLAAVAYYDLGVAELAQGDLPAARDAFFAALELDPSDEQARFNLEWALRAANAPAPNLDPGAGAKPDTSDAEQESQPANEPGASERAPAIPEMSAAQRRRWLERAEDDPAHWLRTAAGEPEAPNARAARPAW